VRGAVGGSGGAECGCYVCWGVYCVPDFYADVGIVLLVSKNCDRENGSVESIGEEAGHDGEVIRGAVDVAC
jgi:hypothetical protein